MGRYRLPSRLFLVALSLPRLRSVRPDSLSGSRLTLGFCCCRSLVLSACCVSLHAAIERPMLIQVEQAVKVSRRICVERWEDQVARIANKDALLRENAENSKRNLVFAGLLIGAHAACLGYCIKVLQDYASGNPANKGIGILVIIFGLGLTASLINYAALYFARMVVQNALRDDRDPNDEASRDFLAFTAWYSLLGAGGFLILGPLVFVVRYAFY
jgi:hypothetical protein